MPAMFCRTLPAITRSASRPRRGMWTRRSAYEMLAALALAGVVQLVPAIKGKQPFVIVRDHPDGASASGQVYLGDLGPGEFFGVEDHLGWSVELAGEAVTEFDTGAVRPCRK